jgi:hypothetical protein
MTPTRIEARTQLSKSVAATTAESRRQTQTLPSRSAPCRLDCANGGRCEYTGTDEAQLSHDIQSGRLVQTCVCLPGFVGMGCEIPSPCAGDHEEQGTQCDYCTVVADEMSKFAGMMCRKPFTEYCNAATATTDFCTNGGKCMASFVAAHFAPGNTTANSQFAGLGCICNPAFYGPHCELLKLPHHVDVNPTLFDTETFTTASVDSSTNGSSATIRDTESDKSNNSNSNKNNKILDVTSVFNATVLVASVASFVIVVAVSMLIRHFRHQRLARRRHLYGNDMPSASSGLMRGGYGGASGEQGGAAEVVALTRAGRNII